MTVHLFKLALSVVTFQSVLICNDFCTVVCVLSEVTSSGNIKRKNIPLYTEKISNIQTLVVNQINLLFILLFNLSELK